MIASPKEPLKDSIIDHIYHGIVNEEFQQGSQIKELHLSEKLGVSRAPVREAMLELVSLGILEQIARKGVFVKAITSKDIFDTYEAKGILEGFLASEFALQASHLDIALLENYLAQMVNPQNSSKKVVQDGDDFHKHCLKYAKNKALLDALSKINKKSQILFYQNWTKLYSLSEIKERHQKIVDAIKTKNKNHVEAVIREHYFETGTKIVLLREVR